MTRNITDEYTSHYTNYKGYELNLIIPKHGFSLPIDRDQLAILVFYKYQGNIKCCPWVSFSTDSDDRRFLPILGEEFWHNEQQREEYEIIHGFLDPATVRLQPISESEDLFEEDYLIGDMQDLELLKLQDDIQSKLASQDFINVDFVSKNLNNLINVQLQRFVKFLSEEERGNFEGWLSAQIAALDQLYKKNVTPMQGVIAMQSEQVGPDPVSAPINIIKQTQSNSTVKASSETSRENTNIELTAGNLSHAAAAGRDNKMQKFKEDQARVLRDGKPNYAKATKSSNARNEAIRIKRMDVEHKFSSESESHRIEGGGAQPNYAKSTQSSRKREESRREENSAKGDKSR